MAERAYKGPQTAAMRIEQFDKCHLSEEEKRFTGIRTPQTRGPLAAWRSVFSVWRRGSETTQPRIREMFSPIRKNFKLNGAATAGLDAAPPTPLYKPNHISASNVQ